MTPTAPPAPADETTESGLARLGASTGLAAALLAALMIYTATKAHALDAPILMSVLVGVVLCVFYSSISRLIQGKSTVGFWSWRTLAITAVTITAFEIIEWALGSPVLYGALTVMLLRYALGSAIAAAALGAFARVDKALTAVKDQPTAPPIKTVDR